MRLSTILVVLLLSATIFSGCFEDSGDDGGDDTLYQDGRGNSILSRDGKRYLVDRDGGMVRLDARISSIGPLMLTTGEIERIVIDAKGNGALILPDFIHPVIDGRLCNQSIVPFSGSGTIELLTAPCLGLEASRGMGQIRAIGEGDKMYTFTIAEGDDPLVSAEYWFDLMTSITDDADGYNGRYVGAGSPQLERAAEYALGLFEGYGLEAEIVRYPASTNADNFVINVVGYKWGLDRKEWIVVGGHFDVAPPPNGVGTWEGAYDNTAGSCAVLSLAKAVSTIETNRSIVFGLWSSEEEGLHGSRAFVNDLPSDVTVKAAINLDMIGLAYPSEGKTVNGMLFPDDDAGVEHPYFMSYINNSIHEILDLPVDTEKFHIREGGTSGSDHTSFYREGIPSVIFISGPVSHYHDPYDDLEHLIEDAGSEELLIAGVQTALWINIYTIIQLDDEGHVHP